MRLLAVVTEIAQILEDIKVKQCLPLAIWHCLSCPDKAPPGKSECEEGSPTLEFGLEGNLVPRRRGSARWHISYLAEGAALEDFMCAHFGRSGGGWGGFFGGWEELGSEASLMVHYPVAGKGSKGQQSGNDSGGQQSGGQKRKGEVQTN